MFPDPKIEQESVSSVQFANTSVRKAPSFMDSQKFTAVHISSNEPDTFSGNFGVSKNLGRLKFFSS